MPRPDLWRRRRHWSPSGVRTVSWCTRALFDKLDRSRQADLIHTVTSHPVWLAGQGGDRAERRTAASQVSRQTPWGMRPRPGGYAASPVPSPSGPPATGRRLLVAGVAQAQDLVAWRQRQRAQPGVAAHRGVIDGEKSSLRANSSRTAAPSRGRAVVMVRRLDTMCLLRRGGGNGATSCVIVRRTIDNQRPRT